MSKMAGNDENGDNLATIPGIRDVHYDECTQNSRDDKSNSGARPQSEKRKPTSSKPPFNAEAATAAILKISCKDLRAELHTEKFGSGTRSRCVKFGDRWITPCELETLSGLLTKKWKRNLRFDGHSLHTLIDKGILSPHVPWCACNLCEETPTDSQITRTAAPSRKKRKIRDASVQLQKPKQLNSTTESSTTLVSVSSANLKPAYSATSVHVHSATETSVSSINDVFNPVAEALTRIKHLSLPPGSEDAWNVVEDAVDEVVTAANSVKTLIQTLKKNADLRPQQDHVRAEPVADCPGAFLAFANTYQPKQGKAQEYSTQVMNPNSYKSVESYSYQDEYLVSKCENCGQDGFLHCTGCHIVLYCSTECQQSDWHRHQFSCLGQLLRETQS